MEEAKIVMIENERTTQDAAKDSFEKAGHIVVKQIFNLQDAEKYLEGLANAEASGENICDVIGLDGNLSPESSNCADGLRLYDLSKKLGIRARLIDFSADSFRMYGIKDLPDSRKNFGNFLEIISKF